MHVVSKDISEIESLYRRGACKPVIACVSSAADSNVTVVMVLAVVSGATLVFSTSYVGTVDDLKRMVFEKLNCPVVEGVVAGLVPVQFPMEFYSAGGIHLGVDLQGCGCRLSSEEGGAGTGTAALSDEDIDKLMGAVMDVLNAVEDSSEGKGKSVRKKQGSRA